MVSRLTPAYSAPSLTVNQVFIRPSRVGPLVADLETSCDGDYAPRRAGDVAGAVGRGCGRSTGIEPWAHAVPAAWATISAIASVPHETRRVFVTEGPESSAALV